MTQHSSAAFGAGAFSDDSWVSSPLWAFTTETYRSQAGLQLAEWCPKAGGLTAATVSNALAKGTGHVAPVMEAPIQLLSLTH